MLATKAATHAAAKATPLSTSSSAACSSAPAPPAPPPLNVTTSPVLATAMTSAASPVPPPPPSPPASAFGPTSAGWRPPTGANCNYCGANDHWMANCPLRHQHLAARKANASRPVGGRRNKPCPYCGRMNHPGERCWTEFPHLRPPNFTPRAAATGPRPPRPQHANLAATPATPSATSPSETAGMAAMTIGSVSGVQRAKWDHVAEPKRGGEAVFVTALTAKDPPPSTTKIHLPAEVKRSPEEAVRVDRSLTCDGSAAVDSSRYALLVPHQPPEGMHSLSLCRCLLKVETQYGGRPFRMIVDTGATVNLVRKDWLEVTADPVEVTPVPILNVTGTTTLMRQQVTLLLELNSYPYAFDFYVADNLPADAILGIDAIVEAGWIIDVFRRCLYHLTHAIPPVPLAPCSHTVVLAYAAADFELPPRTWKRVAVKAEAAMTAPGGDALLLLTPSPPVQLAVHGAPTVMQLCEERPCVLLCNYGIQSLSVESGSPLAIAEVCVLATAGVSPASSTAAQKRVKSPKVTKVREVFDFAQAQANWPALDVYRLECLLTRWRQVWDEPEIVGRTHRWEHRVDTGSAQPIALPMRRVAWVERDTIRAEVDKMRAQNVVVESDSPWSSPPVLVQKKDGTIRFCIDYRRLNDVTIPDQYPLPRIDDVLDALEHGRYFSVIDLKAGYWQIPMRREDAAKTAFRTTDGLFQFTVMPFGLRNAPATFQRLMDVVFSGLKWQGLLVYLDDIIIYSANAERHLLLLGQVLARLADAGLKLNPKKTTLVSREVNYLGHVVSAQGVRPDPKKITAVMQLSAPTSVREVRSFLGLAGYYRRFIDAFAAVAAPLYQLTKKGTPFVWEASHQAAFDSLKNRLCSAPILSYPRRDRDFVLDCDASDDAAGAVLTQVDGQGQEVVVQYASYTFTGAERRWPTMEKEAYAVVWAMGVFRPYLLGRPFVVRTDNAATSYLQQARQPKLQRWAVALSEYSFTVRHRPGKLHSHVDALSRLPVDGERQQEYDLDVPHPTLSAFLAGEVVARHATLPSIDWAAACVNDAECIRLREYVLGLNVGHPLPTWFTRLSAQEKGCFLVQHPYVVYRGFPPRDRPRWFVPTVLRRAVIAAYHRGSHGAHLGVSKMTRQLSQHFYWPGMADAVRAGVRACERCQRAKAAPRIAKAGRLLNRAAMWTTVAFDFFGPLPRTQRGNLYVLVGIDHFSRWPEAVATRVANSRLVAEFLHTRIIAQHGTPRELLTDHGTPFASQVIATLCQHYGIRRLMSTPYTPQSNGIVERFMGYLKNALITLIDQRPTTWDLHLSAVLFAYRATPHPCRGRPQCRRGRRGAREG